ncbi:MAG: hypothetical protein PVI52_01640 [Chromatiales bacterium]|jgi:hypothetical protein
MSGEVVLVPLIWESFTGIASAVMAATEARKEVARQRAEQERQRIREWQDFQARQGEEQRRLRQLGEAMRQAQEQLMAMGLNNALARNDGGPAAQGYLEAATGEAAIWLERMAAQLDALPAELFTDEHLAFSRLRGQLNELRNAAPSVAEARSYYETLQRTVQEHQRQLDAELLQQQSLADAAQQLLTRILATRELTDDVAELAQLDRLQHKLITTLRDGQVTPAELDILTNRFAPLQTQIEQRAGTEGMNDLLVDRMTHHLNEMGYATLSAFTDRKQGRRRDAEFALPDGDRLRVALQPDLRMAFQLTHETHTMVEKTLTGEALEFFRQQEARWCRDMKELIRRLIKDGVPYEIQFAREMAAGSIPLVVMETVDDLLAEEEEEARWRDSRKERRFE